jgi:formamidopyrimidine-DNA glycosylase
VPELPEVEAVARSLHPLVAGKTILCVRVLHAIAVKPQSAAHLKRVVQGRRVEGVERRGKYLLLRLDRGWVVLHFRLDGQLVWFDSRRVAGHIDVTFEFSHGTLGFVDRRHFGRVQYLAHAEDSRGIGSLGVDALSPAFTERKLEELAGKARGPLKLFLLDQARIAGLGNIYSSESLWRARLDPRRHANRLSRAELRRLHNSIVYVLRAALECCTHPAPNFRDAEWWFQGLERIMRVYQLEGRPCRRCGKKIKRIEQGGRSTFFCPRCQR